MKFMFKRFCKVLVVAIVCLSGLTFAQAQSKSVEPKITEAESQKAQDFAKRFCVRFLETGDLAPLLDEFYFSDFIDRYKKFMSGEYRKINNYFVPSIFYDSKITREVNSEDWRRFYVSANNFILLGYIAAVKNAKINPGKEADFDIVKFYSPSVVELFGKNPNLANTFIKKSGSKSISSAEEMRSVTATLDNALTILHKRQGNTPLLEMNDKDWAKVLKKDYFKPTLQVSDEEYFRFPKNTRFIVVKTSIGMQLLLANDKDKLKIVWADINID